MVPPILVRGSYRDSYLYFFVVAVPLAAVVSWGGTRTKRPEQVNWGAGICAAAAALAAGRYVQLKRRRVFLQPEDAGFRAIDASGTETAYADEDLLSIALDFRFRMRSGIAAGFRRKGTLILAEPDGTRTIGIDYTARGLEDPLGTLFTRLFQNLAERTRAHFDAGGNLPGLGWELNRDGLLVQPKRGEPVLVEHGNLAAISRFDRHITVWERDNPYPAVRIPSGAMNALVLHAVLHDKIGSTPYRSPEGSGPDGLGRILFERNSGVDRWLRIVLVVIGLGLLGLMFGAADEAEKQRANNPRAEGFPAAGYIMMGGLAALFLTIASNVTAKTFRVQEFGVSIRRYGRAAILPYTDIATLSWNVIRHYVRSQYTLFIAVYTGTNLSLKIRPPKKSGLPIIAFSKSLRGTDDDLDNLRDYLARAIADKMLDRLRTGTAVRWIEGYGFGPDRLRGGQKLALVGYPDGLPYQQISGHTFKEGYFHLFVHGEPKSILWMRTNAENFYPGFALLQAILAGVPTTAIPAPSDG